MLRAESMPRPGGLNLADPVDAVGAGGAIDLLDVDWDGAGNLRSRPPFAAVTTAAADPYSTFAPISPTLALLARGSKLVAYSLAVSEEVAETSMVVALQPQVTVFGTPAATTAWAFMNGVAPFAYDVASKTFSTPTATVDGATGKKMPYGRRGVAWPEGDNRLVVMGTTPGKGPNELASDDSTVWFSEPGNPTSFESTAKVPLTPGDGESIVCGCVWGGKVFVFKETRLFVFYGVAEDEEGRPEFLLASYNLPSRVVRAANGMQNCVVATEGVYFLTGRGVWLTTGGIASPVSQDLEPMNRPDTLPSSVSESIGTRRWTDAWGMVYLNGLLYIGLRADGSPPVGPTDRMLRYDTRSGDWSVWRSNHLAIGAWSANSEETAVLTLYATGSGETLNGKLAPNKLCRIDGPSGSSSDVLCTPTPRWRSGFYDFGSADEKALTEVKTFGGGTVALRVAQDYAALDATERQLKMTGGTSGGAGADQARVQAAQKATCFSHQFSGTNWWIQRAIRYLESTQVPASETR